MFKFYRTDLCCKQKHLNWCSVFGFSWTSIFISFYEPRKLRVFTDCPSHFSAPTCLTYPFAISPHLNSTFESYLLLNINTFFVISQPLRYFLTAFDNTEIPIYLCSMLCSKGANLAPTSLIALLFKSFFLLFHKHCIYRLCPQLSMFYCSLCFSARDFLFQPQSIWQSAKNKSKGISP